MTREEEVEIISERYGANSLMYGKLHNDTLKGLLKHYQEGFVAGVKWADKNPKSPWISVEDDLPCNHVELLVDCFQTKYVEACFTHLDGSSFVTIEKMVRVDVGMDKDCWQWSSNLREHVTYWKPIPEPPKE